MARQSNMLIVASFIAVTFLVYTVESFTPTQRVARVSSYNIGRNIIQLHAAEDDSNGSGLPPLPSQKIREIGPLEKKALEKHQKESTKQQLPKEDEEVSAILGDEELHSILLDPKMQEVMRECSQGNKLNYYMSHPEIGPKLQRLVQAKLMQVA